MAALANGVPVVTTIGALSEPIWGDGAVAAITVGDTSRIVELVVELLDSSNRRDDLGRAGRRLYDEQFSIGRTVDILLQ
jgi:glycosyltransferase involved in cell wall biosynthesis